MYNIYGAEISKETESTVTEESNVSGLLRLFPKIGVLGDSISSGTICYSNQDSSDTLNNVQYEYAWSEIICRKYGLDNTNFSKGGVSAVDWENTFKKVFPDSEAKYAYFIALGTNDSGDTMGDEYSTDVTTFGGAYNHLIDLCLAKNENAAIFCISPYAIPGTEAKCEVYRIIRQICKLRDNCFWVDVAGKMTDPSDYKYKYWWNGHPNTMGNLVLANIIENQVNKVIVNNWDFFAKFGGLQNGAQDNPLLG